ncbi:MAG TPA: hypothetical protein VLT87_11160 [Thermoanaerobaculia bacterium]|nr:hypothetical protein [Thermoanaerobaculia bacterium]
MADPHYTFLVPFDGHPHPARLSPCGEFLLIRVWESEGSGPVEVQQAIGGPVGSVVRDLWALCGKQQEVLRCIEFTGTDEDPFCPECFISPGAFDAATGSVGEHYHHCSLSQALKNSAAQQAGAEWERLKQVEARIATENPLRLPSEHPEHGSRVRIVVRWGEKAKNAEFLVDAATTYRWWAKDDCFRDQDIVAWQYDLPVEMPEGWPGSAPATRQEIGEALDDFMAGFERGPVGSAEFREGVRSRSEAPSPSSGGVDDAGNAFELGGGR